MGPRRGYLPSIPSKEEVMLHVRDATQVGVGIGEKVVGLSAEIAGTILGNGRLRDRGRQLGEAGTERLQAVEEEVKSAGRQAEARAHETKQRTHQRDRSTRKGP